MRRAAFFATIIVCFTDMKENIEVTRFENGLTILTETMPDVRSITLGFWLKTGSRHEPADLNGICHFIEHAVFKGTNKRSALDIAIETDRLGGNFDAFTSHENVGFMVKVVDNKLDPAFDLIADMLTNPVFDEKEMRRERRVIIEEMKMVEDSPEEYLGELFLNEFFPGSALGLPIEGTRKTVKNFNHAILSEFHKKNYSADNLIIAAAGNVEHQAIIDLANKFFAPESKIRKPETSDPTPKIAAPILLTKKRDLEQAHLILATPWIAAGDERRYAASLLTSILGDGNSSRLWQTIREKRGLAYSVGASANSFDDCGIFSIYAGTSPDKLGEVVDLSIAELKKIKRKGVSVEELNLAKEQTLASVLLGLEDSGSRAGSLAQMEITFGKLIPLEETLKRIETVTIEEIQALAEEFFQTEKLALAALGNLNGLKITRERLDVS
ncbi:MAG: peptidase family [Acidobacteria bacterium]|jgi:predicted Zn-dependent peptidase|nr:peptidase family [Acidobacteriota bacterium]